MIIIHLYLLLHAVSPNLPMDLPMVKGHLKGPGKPRHWSSPRPRVDRRGRRPWVPRPTDRRIPRGTKRPRGPRPPGARSKISKVTTEVVCGIVFLPII